ncbi:MAG TPA: hypothetical protein VK626_01750 [Nitrospiraceae bacterium]|nr:hypothetical protein [Nitrospiraceae bacterium]
MNAPLSEEERVPVDDQHCIPPRVVEPRRMTLTEAIKWAMEGQTRLIDAQVKVCIWESERIVKQARDNPTWDTCFHTALWELNKEWERRHVTS